MKIRSVGDVLFHVDGQTRARARARTHTHTHTRARARARAHGRTDRHDESKSSFSQFWERAWKLRVFTLN
jgi:hypothetical protein